MADPAEHLLERGTTALTEHDFREAIECFTRYLKDNPHSVHALQARARAYLGLNDRPRAICDYDSAIQYRPDDAQLRIERADALSRQRRYDAAIEDCHVALQSEPHNIRALGIRAKCHSARGDSAAALADMTRIIELDPDNAPRVLLQRARLQTDLGNAIAARADIDQALRLEPDLIPALEHRARLHHEAARYDEAIRDFQELARRDPRAITYIHSLALAQFAAGKLEDCVASIGEALTLKPDAVMLLELRSESRRRLGQLDDALADVNRAIELSGGRGSLHKLRGVIRCDSGHYTEALRDYLRALDSGVADPHETLNAIARIFACCDDDSIRDAERGLHFATRACEITGFCNPQYLDTLAAAHALSGDFASACDWMLKAIALGGTDAERDQYQARLTLYQRGEVFIAKR